MGGYSPCIRGTDDFCSFVWIQLVVTVDKSIILNTFKILSLQWMFGTFSEEVPSGTLHAAKERKGPKPNIWTARPPENAEP